MKKFGIAVLLTLAGEAPAWAQQQQQFDLICEGQSTSGTDSQKSWSDHIRVDLVSRQWCKGTCYYVNPIQDVSADEITLKDSTGSVNSDTEVLDRRAGTFRFETGTSLGGGFFERGGGQCRIALFSGFPSRKF